MVPEEVVGVERWGMAPEDSNAGEEAEAIGEEGQISDAVKISSEEANAAL